MQDQTVNPTETPSESLAEGKFTEREKKLAEIAAWAKSINDREHERLLRYLVSALSSDQIHHRPKSTVSTSAFLAKRFGEIL
jgi:hypothetical protein